MKDLIYREPSETTDDTDEILIISGHLQSQISTIISEDIPNANIDLQTDLDNSGNILNIQDQILQNNIEGFADTLNSQDIILQNNINVVRTNLDNSGNILNSQDITLQTNLDNSGDILNLEKKIAFVLII